MAVVIATTKGRDRLGRGPVRAGYWAGDVPGRSSVLDDDRDRVVLAKTSRDTGRAMSQENVDLLRKLQPSPDIDLVELFRDGPESERAGRPRSRWAA
jgi:hypothetical protein